MFLRTFGVSIGATVLILAGAFALGGPQILAVVALLAILEVSLSFDNAVVNATVLQRMSPFWQKVFLTVGIAIAVFGMRLLFPLLIVAITAGLGPVEVIDLALNNPDAYSAALHAAHPAIAAFGGIFLLMIFLDFVFEDREHTWLAWIEKPLARIGAIDALSTVVALITLVTAAQILAGEHSGTVMMAGVLGLVTYLVVNSLAAFFETEGEGDDEDAPAGIHGAAKTGGPSSLALATGKAGLFLFLYLEVLDASFSFDGVIGAFAISSNILVIAAGLGVGAFYIRSLTVYLVRKGTLGQYVYLEHGAHYAIGALGALLFVTLKYDVPEVVTGLIGVGFIGAAFIGSILRNRREEIDLADPVTKDRELDLVGL